MQRYVKVPVPDTLTHADIAAMQDRAALAVEAGMVFILVAVPPNLSEETYEALQQAITGVVGEMCVSADDRCGECGIPTPPSGAAHMASCSKAGV